jgi:DNA-binding LacI/PurR family transcriptional regulator
MVVSSLANTHIHAPIAAGVARVLAPQGYHTVMLDTGSEEGEQRSLEAVRRERMAGAIIDAYHLLGRPAEIHRRVGGCPLVLITDLDETYNVSRLLLPNFAAAYEATAYLAARGYRRIAHITGTPGMVPTLRRQEGYRRALRDAGLGPPLEVPGDYLLPSGKQAMAALLELAGPVDAVFAANDLMAVGALLVLQERGIGVPGQVALVGFDNIEATTWTSPPLTTVDQPADWLGATAADLLLASLLRNEPPRAVEVPCTLVRRGSA